MVEHTAHTSPHHIVGDEATNSNPRLQLTKNLIEEGTLLGLSGADLRAYVVEERDRIEREEHVREERDRIEREEHVREERDREERDREERERERNFQLEQLRIQSANQNNRNNNARESSQSKDNFDHKIPYLEDKDDIESWFHQYEHYAKDCKLVDATKASRIVYFLKGKARVIYSKLSAEDADDYETVKHALYEGFQLTSKDYRKKFRNLKKAQGDTYKEHFVKLDRYMNKWIELAKCGNEVDDLKDLILREQILETVPPELAIHIRDRNPHDAKEIGEIATTYHQARSNTKVPDADAHSRGKGNRFSKNDGNGRDVKQSTVMFGSSQHSTAQPHKLSDEERTKLRTNGQCFFCKERGHLSKNCPKRSTTSVVPNVNETGRSFDIPEKLEKLCEDCQSKTFSETIPVKVDGKLVQAIRDSGCTGIMVSAELVSKDKYLLNKKEVTLAEKGAKKMYPTAVVHIDSPFFDADTEVTVMDNPVYPVLIGKWHGIGSNKCLTSLYPIRDPTWFSETVAAVNTRAQQKEEEKKSEASVPPNLKSQEKPFTPEDLKREQKADPSLAQIREFATKGREIHGVKFVYKNDILLRSKLHENGCYKTRVVVPKKLRPKVLSFGHDLPLAGHLGQKKTFDRINTEFWWPGHGSDIKRYCMSCDACQRSTPKGHTKKVPLGRMPPISSVFKRIAVDIIGPIKPISESKKQYILVSVDYATRFPEAVALKDIRAETIAESLWEMWTRLGIPDEVITDQGAQFSGKLMHEVNDFLQVKHHMTAPFHPQSNGLVERFNGTLKSMMTRMTQEQPKKWDTFIPALLFAYREVPQASLGFSPFELLYGRAVKGPMQILRQAWTQEEVSDEMKTTAEYVVDLRNRIEKTCEIARENLKNAAMKQAKYFDKKAAKREIEVGKRVLLLRPKKQNKLELLWQGPYTVVEKLNQFDYKIKIGRKIKLYHINLMKEYQERDTSFKHSTPTQRVDAHESSEEEEDEVVAIVMEEDETMSDDIFATETQKMLPLLGRSSSTTST
ncbi:uncharacterized protein [Littorina saxatilis]|uniref:uncharacterized protein n=1 Tax=Littorina saxatilis TaxID=31220 RepID=UPI0038B5B69E